MSINSKCLANPKHANVQKSALGESVDYTLLKTIKNADISTPEGLKIRNKAIIELKDKYKAAIEGSCRKLVEMCSGHYTVLSQDIVDNYEYDCYEHFMMAVNGMDLKRIQHMKGSYSFYIQLVRYLAAYNRKVINTYCGGTPKEKPLEMYRPATDTDEKSIRLIVNGKEARYVKVKSSDDLRDGYVLRNSDKSTFAYNPNFTYLRDKLGKVTSVLNVDDEVVFKNRTSEIRKLDACNVRSEWITNSEGKEVSIFDTDSVKYTTVEEQMERQEESDILREAIGKAYAKFNGLQKNIWNTRMTQSAEQYEKKLNDGKKATELEASSKPKFEDLGKRCDVSASVVKENMNAMREMISLEIDAANRKYHTHISF
jgi:hypothetical protein